MTSEGEPGTAVYWCDPEGNQLEFWASERPPNGAFNGSSALGIGRISHVVYASRDLRRSAEFFRRYCGLRALPDTAADTLVMPLAAGGRLIFKSSAVPGARTSGRGIYFDLHTALVVRESDFWPNYERVWNDLPEWTYSFEERNGSYIGDGARLPARTMEHASPAGRRWKAAFGRGDDWLDWDANLFHFYGGEPNGGSMTHYKPHAIEDYMDAYLATHSRARAGETV